MRNLKRRLSGLRERLRAAAALRRVSSTLPGGGRSQKPAQSVDDLLWEALHSVTGATGRGNNAPFVDFYLDICEQIRPAVSFEIGAREADFSLRLKSRLPQARCYAFEANPHVFEQFRHSVKDIVYLNEAIGADSSTKPFFIPVLVPSPRGSVPLPRTNRSSSLKPRRSDGVEYEKVSCKCDTLDAWHKRLGWPKSVLWIDVEGAIGDVIEGGERSFATSVQCIYVELEKRSQWADQWLAPDVIQRMKLYGFVPLARDHEASWQFNQVFVRESLVKTGTVNLVRKYIGGLVRGSSARSEAPPVPSANAEEPESFLIAGSPADESHLHPDKAQVVSWLLSQKLVTREEGEQMGNAFRLPKGFEQRVLTKFPKARAVASAPPARSIPVIAAEPDEHIGRPGCAFDGPYPPNFDERQARYPAVELHVVQGGKIFLGFRHTTLILDGDTYLAAISSPASSWITPVFAECPGGLKLPGTVAVLFANGASLFSHWMFDLLPKLEVLRRAGWTDDRIDYYVVNSFRENYQGETIDRLGIPRDKIITVNGAVVSADRLLFPSDIRMGLCTPAWVAEYVRSIFEVPQGRTLMPGNSSLYISRSHALRRRIVNEQEVASILGRRGFKTIFAEEVGVAKCAELVAEAGRIFAPHGAGAANVVFANPGVRMLESYSAHISPEYWMLTQARAAGRHCLLVGDDQNGRRPWEAGAFEGLSPSERNAADYVIRPGDLEHALEMMMDG